MIRTSTDNFYMACFARLQILGEWLSYSTSKCITYSGFNR